MCCCSSSPLPLSRWHAWQAALKSPFLSKGRRKVEKWVKKNNKKIKMLIGAFYSCLSLPRTPPSFEFSFTAFFFDKLLTCQSPCCVFCYHHPLLPPSIRWMHCRRGVPIRGENMKWAVGRSLLSTLNITHWSFNCLRDFRYFFTLDKMTFLEIFQVLFPLFLAFHWLVPSNPCFLVNEIRCINISECDGE